MRPKLGRFTCMPHRLRFCVNFSFLRLFTCRLATVIGVRCRQPDADAALVDLKAQTALTVIVSLLAQFQVFSCVIPQPLLQVRFVGLVLRKWVFCVVVHISCLLFFCKTGFHGNPPVFRKFSSALEPGKRACFPIGSSQRMTASIRHLLSDFS